MRALPARRAQDDMVVAAFQFQRVARADLQRVTHRFGQDYASGLVDRQSGRHNGNYYTISYAIKNGIDDAIGRAILAE